MLTKLHYRNLLSRHTGIRRIKQCYIQNRNYTQGHSEGIFLGGCGSQFADWHQWRSQYFKSSGGGGKCHPKPQLGKSSVLRNTIRLQSENPWLEVCRLNIYSGPILVLVPLMLHLPTEALNADWEQLFGGVTIHTPTPHPHTPPRYRPDYAVSVESTY